MPVPRIDSSFALTPCKAREWLSTWKDRHLPTSGMVFIKQINMFDLLGVESKGNEYLMSPMDVHVSL